jgi:hypothetical protein
MMPFVLDLHGYLDGADVLCTRSTRYLDDDNAFVLDLHGYLDDDNALCTRSTRLFGFFSTDHE